MALFNIVSWSGSRCKTVSLAILSFVLIVPTFTYVPQSQMFPYLDPSEATQFYFGDDGYTSVPFIDKFQFLGKNYSQAYINGNGIITFGQGSGSYNYQCNPNATIIPTIAVYMADAFSSHDPTGIKLLHKSQVTNSTALEAARKDVVAAFPSLAGKLALRELLIVTWHNISLNNAYINFPNTFQATLATDNKYSFLLLYYNRIEWPSRKIRTIPAQAGVFGGRTNLANTYIIPGSCNFSIVNIAGMSNIGQPGKFVFRVDTNIEQPQELNCLPISATPRMEPLQFKPTAVPAMGSVPLLVQGFDLCLNHNLTQINCTFHDVNRAEPELTVGSVVPGQLAVICPTPGVFYSLGRVRIDLGLEFSQGQVINSYGFVYVVNTRHSVGSHVTAYRSVDKKMLLSVAWNSSNFNSSLDQISGFLRTQLNRESQITAPKLNLTFMELDNFTRWTGFYNEHNISNSGFWMFSPPENFETTLISDKVGTSPRTVKFSSNTVMDNGDNLMLEFVTKVEETTSVLGQLKNRSFYDNKCQLWYDHQPAPPNDSLPCPNTMGQAVADWRFSWSDTLLLPIFITPITVFIQSVPSLSGAASRCAYDDKEELITGLPSSSILYRFSPNGRRTYLRHYWEDVIPQEVCCKWNSFELYGCRKYFEPKRPLHDRSLYEFPIPFRATGATHVNTINGGKYLLSGLGFYWLLKSSSHLDIQVLLEKYSGSPNTTSITGVVMKSYVGGDSGNWTKFQVGATQSGKLLLWMDEEPLNFYYDKLYDSYEYVQDNFTLNHDGVTVQINGTIYALFSFSTGVSIKITASGGHDSLNIVGLMSQTMMRGNITGLLGNFDGDLYNDFQKSRQLTNVDLNQFYKEFVEKWRVTMNETLFVTPPRKNYSSYFLLPIDFQHYDIMNEYGNITNPTTGSLGTSDEGVFNSMFDYQLTSSEIFARNSLEAYKDFESLVNASKIVNRPTECDPPKNITNGGYLMESFSTGSTIQPYCDVGYFKHIPRDNLEERLGENLNFICIPTAMLSDTRQLAVQERTKVAVWVSTESSRPLSTYTMECLSKEEVEGRVEPVTRIKVTPGAVSVLGDEPLFVVIPFALDMEHLVRVICNFGSRATLQTMGTIIDGQSNTTKIKCAVPVLPALGKMIVTVTVKYVDKPTLHFEGSFWVLRPEDNLSLRLNVSLGSNGSQLMVNWNTSSFGAVNGWNDSCDLSLVVVVKKGPKLRQTATIKSNICNLGNFETDVKSLEPFIFSDDQTLWNVFTHPSVLMLKNNVELQEYQDNDDAEFLSEGISSGLLPSITTLYGIIAAHGLHTTSKTWTRGGVSMKRKPDDNTITSFDQLCKQWYDRDNDLYSHDVLQCPRSVEQAEADATFVREFWGHEQYPSSDATSLFIQRTATTATSKSGSLCIYNKNGTLLVGSPTGSRIQRYRATGWDTYWDHYSNDVLPYLVCCKWSTNAKKNCKDYFYDKRQLPLGGNYVAPSLSHVWGTTHIQTFDNSRYRFNGAGEFWMLKHESPGIWTDLEQFQCQVRLEPYYTVLAVGEEQSPFSVVTALAVKQSIQGKQVSVQISRNSSDSTGYNVWVDGDGLHLENLRSLYYQGFSISTNETTSLRQLMVVFQYGFSFMITASAEQASGMSVIISASSHLRNQIAGLLGNFDGNQDNDFVTPNGTVFSQEATVEDIHQFGRSWRVSKNETIFTYSIDGSSYSQYYPDVPLATSFDALDVNQANESVLQMCDYSQECIFDLFVTNNPGLSKAGAASWHNFNFLTSALGATVVDGCNETSACNYFGPRDYHRVEASANVGSNFVVILLTILITTLSNILLVVLVLWMRQRSLWSGHSTDVSINLLDFNN